MKKNKFALSITEAMVVLLIVTMWLVWVYGILTRSFKVTSNLWNKITAIQIAREWIEAVQNMRDTNWLLFPLDKENCWITENYNPDCFWDETNNKWSIPYYVMQDSKSYKVYKWKNWRWYLEKPENEINWWYINSDYRDFFVVNVDDNWLFTQSWGTSFSPTFTRQIILTHTNWNPNDSSESNVDENWYYHVKWLNIKSIVRWQDNSSNTPSEVVLETTLTNYKK